MNREAYIRKNIDALFQHWLARGCAWGAALFLSLSALDYLIAPQYFGLFLKYRAIMSLLLLVISYASTRFAGRTVNYVLAYGAIAGSAATIELMILRLGGHASSYYPGMILLCVGSVGFIPARFIFHASATALIYLIYVLPIITIEQITNGMAFVTANAFMGLIFITVLFMRYLASLSLIQELGFRYDLEQSRERLEEAVQDRTNELSRAVLRLQQEIEGHQLAELQLRRNTTALQEKNDELGSFVFSISHDLRTPLVNIKGFMAELESSLQQSIAILNDADVRIDDNKRELLKTLARQDIPNAMGFIHTSSDKIQTLINSFLKLSRLGAKELVSEPIDMDDLVRTSMGKFAQEINRKNIIVTLRELPNMVGDRTALAQIVGSILDNAIKYLVPGRPGEIEITGELRASEVLFRFRDNGRGIAPDEIPRVFDYFRRLGPQEIAGEGMGLVYAKTLVKRHDGRIWCESEPGIGTVLSFTIPTSPTSKVSA